MSKPSTIKADRFERLVAHNLLLSALLHNMERGLSGQQLTSITGSVESLRGFEFDMQTIMKPRLPAPEILCMC